MANSKKVGETEKDLGAIENVLSTSERFVEKNQKALLIGLAVVVAVVLGYLLFQSYYVAPREKAAEEMMSVGQRYFMQEKYKVALNGDSVEFDGFLSIIDNYKMTESANLAAAYAGICYYRLGKYDNAIKYLNQFSGDDKLVSFSVLGTIGDCYVQKGQIEKGIEYFLKAGSAESPLIAPLYLMKAGKAYESLSKYDKAIEMYKQIKEKYTNQISGFSTVEEIDKYIERAKSAK